MGEDRPLRGIRVLDLTRLLPGEMATQVLADLGAQVDKVEDAGGGDYMRTMPPLVGGMNATFHALNRGKRSLVLDLKTPEGREAFLRLLPRYDVLIEGFRPGVMERLGLGYDALREEHPGLVYCAITGYGQTGPHKDRAGHDVNYLSKAGVLGLTGPEDGPPQVYGIQIADLGGGALFAAVGILAALEARHRTGEGRFVDVSMCEGSLAFAVYGLTSHLGGLPLPRGAGMLMGGIAPYQVYETKDGKAVSLGALEPKFWMAFCAGVGLEPDMSALAPGPHQAEWKKKIADKIRERTRDEWAKFAEEVDCCLEPVLEPDEVADDPQHRARGIFVDAPAGDGTIAVPRTPVATSPRVEPAPEQGEQGEAILREAGFDDAAIAVLREAGATR